MAGWGGELNYPRFQTSITDGGHGNRLVGALKTLRQRLLPVHERLRTVIVENLEWQACFERYNRPGVVMYVDPPYPGNKCNYAHNMRGWEEHYLLAERLKKQIAGGYFLRMIFLKCTRFLLTTSFWASNPLPG